MNTAERRKLLFGPYCPPALRRGDRATCLARDCDVIVTSWTDARISWPRCRALGTHGGGSGILVDEELARAVRQESAAAIGYWWGVAASTVWGWRRVLGVDRKNNEGSQRLIRAASKAGAEVLKRDGLSPEACQRASERARRLNYAKTLRTGYHGPWWTAKQLALLGKLPDAEVAARIGRTPDAVRCMRTRLGVMTARDRRRRGQR